MFLQSLLVDNGPIALLADFHSGRAYILDLIEAFQAESLEISGSARVS